MPLNLSDIEFDSLTADPTTPPNGRVWHRSDLKQLRIRLSGVTKVLTASNDIISFSSDSSPYVSKSLSASYVAQGGLLFSGTGVLGDPTVIKVVKQANSGSPTHSVKIYDKTNSQTIAEVTAIASTTFDILDMGTLSNLPTGPAWLEIQVKRDAGGAVTLDLYGACIGS